MNKHKQILQTIKKYKSFLISTHVSPDPDALCSELALAEFLRAYHKNIHIVNEEKVPARYSFLPGARSISAYSKGKNVLFDAAIVVDCGDLNRIGKVQELIGKKKIMINIDHHITNDHFGHFNLVDPKASSTAEVLYELFSLSGKPLTQTMALNLYSGILTDTGSFQYESTTPQTHLIAAQLQTFGLPIQNLYKKFYETIPLRDAKEFAKVIGHFESLSGGALITIELSKRTLSEFSDDFDLRDSLFKFLRSIKEAYVFVIFSETADGKTRVNFRSSRKIDVAKIAQQFGGGGHKRASGCVIDGTIKTARTRIINAIEKYL